MYKVLYPVEVPTRKCRSHDDDRAYNPPGIVLTCTGHTTYMWVVIPTGPIQAICTCHVHVHVPQIFLVRQKFSSPRGVFRVIMMIMDGWEWRQVWTTCQYVGCALEVVQHICMCMYMYMCCVCVTMGKRTLPSCSRALPCRQERGREIMRDGVIYS